ncbi:MAG: abortive infection family protein [Acidobacteriota bacterium]|nr:MAG: abortive infection family protein [Acidobacteriota bacterium]
MQSRELIGPRTRTEFREYFVGRILREIESEFSSAGLKPDRDFEPEVGGQRREFVEQYYNAIDFANPADVSKLLEVYYSVLLHLESIIADPGAHDDVPSLRRQHKRLLDCLKRDGYEPRDGKLRPSAGNSLLRHLTATAEKIDAVYLETQVERLAEAVERDPELAIGQAKELVETCCKTILNSYGDSDFDRLDLIRLVKETMRRLKLLPSDIPSGSKGEKTVKAILGNLAMITQGMAELRNLYGTGHGKPGQHRQIPKRHARLAVGAATTLASFLFETFEDRSG